MTYPEFKGTQKLQVEFTEVIYGLIYFRMTLGEKSYETRFSDVYDPLLSFKHWLEAVSTGVHQCSFSFDTEGSDIKFDFERISWDKEIFTVSYDYGDDPPFLSDYVERRQVVKVFYLGFLEFYESSDQLKKNWEVEYMWERFSAITGLDYEAVVEELVRLDRAELKEVLFKASPRYLLSCPSAESDKAWGYLIDNFMGEEVPEEHPIVETPMEWNIEEDYDEWTKDAKCALVKECLSEAANDREGTKIAKFSSKIIADYLELSSEIKIDECIA